MRIPKIRKELDKNGFGELSFISNSLHSCIEDVQGLLEGSQKIA